MRASSSSIRAERWAGLRPKSRRQSSSPGAVWGSHLAQSQSAAGPVGDHDQREVTGPVQGDQVGEHGSGVVEHRFARAAQTDAHRTPGGARRSGPARRLGHLHRTVAPQHQVCGRRAEPDPQLPEVGIGPAALPEPLGWKAGDGPDGGGIREGPAPDGLVGPHRLGDLGGELATALVVLLLLGGEGPAGGAAVRPHVHADHDRRQQGEQQEGRAAGSRRRWPRRGWPAPRRRRRSTWGLVGGAGGDGTLKTGGSAIVRSTAVAC